MYQFIRSLYARLIYFYPDLIIINYLRVSLSIFLLFNWYLLSLLIKLSPWSRDKKYFFISEDNRYIKHYQNLKYNNFIPNSTKLLFNKSKLNFFERILFKKSVYKDLILYILSSKRSTRVYICELANPDSIYFLSVIKFFKCKISYVQHSEIIFTNYWKNFMPFISFYYVRHQFMFDLLRRKYHINKNNICVCKALWNISFINKKNNIRRLFYIGQPIENIVNFLNSYYKNSKYVEYLIKNNFHNLIKKSQNENLSLFYIKHPREETLNFKDEHLRNFVLIKNDQITFYENDLIYGYFSSMLLELSILGFRCNFLSNYYKNTIFEDKIFLEYVAN